MNTIYSALIAPMQQTRVDVFESIFTVFLGLGTLVGIVVVAYTLYNAYKYRDSDTADDDKDRPSLGELPTGGKGGKKLFLSFGISAVIVISLVIWTYTMLLYVEDPSADDGGQQEALEVDVTGEGFAWFFEYDNGIESTSTLRVPADQRVWVQVTSGDVWHTFGIPDQRVKADAIPGEVDESWFEAEEPGEYNIKCFELCGEAHTSMVGTLNVMPSDEFDSWMDDQLTMEFEMVDGNESPVTDGYEMTLESQETDFERTYTADDFDENGTITINDVDHGGNYNVTITSTDGQFETVEEQFDMTGPVSETYTLEMNATESDATASDTNDGGDA
ncbi:cytochrome c oxidase subunit 2 [Natrinema hispanicum]|uniref:Cytochrome c oxidase subunit 2 n=1 Tax=Natrinema hispanicum TaxID=392421 RepID=A0A482YCR4_9EURY|nr:cytochrome c oxidase subunit II [Natrinema hispanicum]RZV11258.1 cytochrome c oxidase subunit 2 [Natrinema hispanicum]RZV11265.1 cytochrome c oxidase subunit 2 [Natrinema hispanicum]